MHHYFDEYIFHNVLACMDYCLFIKFNSFFDSLRDANLCQITAIILADLKTVSPVPIWF